MANPHYFEKLDASAVLDHFRSDLKFGLAKREVLLRQKEHGKNSLPLYPVLFSFIRFFSPATVVCVAMILFALYQNITSPLFWSILTLGGLTQQIIYSILQFPTVLNIVKSYNKKLKVLPKYTTTRRDGKTVSVRSSELVPGDIIYLEKGEHVSADVRILSSDKLIVDESALFGPSKSRTAKSSDIETVVFKAYPSNVVFGGSFIVTGNAKAIVLHTSKKKLHQTAQLRSYTSPLLKGFVWQSGLMVFAILLLTVAHYVTNTVSPLFSWLFLFINPYYVPLYLYALQISTKKKDFSFPANHIVAKIDNFICPDEKNALIYCNKEEIFLGQAPKLKKHAKLVTSFLELCHLAIPGQLFPDQKHAFQDSLNKLTSYLSQQYDISVANDNSSLEFQIESSNYTLENNAIGFESKAVYASAEDRDEVLLTIHTTGPETALDKATYIWDMAEKSQKRRFFPNEKLKLKDLTAHLLEEGYLLYALTLEEQGLAKNTSNIFTYVGFVAIPQVANNTMLKELRRTQEQGLKATLISYTFVPKKFYAEKLGVPLQNIVDAEDIKSKSMQYKVHLMEESMTLITQSTSDVLLTLLDTKRGVWVEDSLDIPYAFSSFSLRKQQHIGTLLQQEQKSALAFDQYQLLCLLSGIQTISFSLLLLFTGWLPADMIFTSALALPLLYASSLFVIQAPSQKKKSNDSTHMRPSLSFSFAKTCLGVIASILITCSLALVYVLTQSGFSTEPWTLVAQSPELRAGLILIWAAMTALPVFAWISKKYLTSYSRVALVAAIIFLSILSFYTDIGVSSQQPLIFTAIIGVLCLLGIVSFSSKSVA